MCFIRIMVQLVVFTLSITNGYAEFLEKFDHKNPGCPENSTCTVEQGQHRMKWLNMIKSVAKSKDPSNAIDSFRKSDGIPVLLYGEGSLKDGDTAAILWDSPCLFHRKREIGKIVSTRMSFVSGAENELIQLNLLGRRFKYLQGPSYFLRPFYVLDPKTKDVTKYLLPLDEYPAYRERGNLVLIRDEDDIFYGLSISSLGRWKVVAHSNQASLKSSRSDIDCPEVLKKYPEGKDRELLDKFFKESYCREIWDVTQSRSVIVKTFWSCP